MLAKYVLLDLVRNPRRTLSSLIGITLGVGLFCGVLFFVDSLSASMTQRAVAPLAIDVQRILSQRVGGTLTLTQHVSSQGTVNAGQDVVVQLELRNDGEFDANEATVRSRPGKGFQFIPESAEIDGVPVTDFPDNPFAHGPGRTGYNLGTVEPGGVRLLSYRVRADVESDAGDAVRSWVSSRESVKPVAANQPPPASLEELAGLIAQIDGVASANQLSFADLGSETFSANGVTAPGMARIFGFDADYADRDKTILIIQGAMTDHGAILSAEAAALMHAGVGDSVSVLLPDRTTIDVQVTGIADLSRARSLFGSRRGADLETFLYRPVSMIVSSTMFADTVFPAYQRSATDRGARLKNPPVREIDVTLDHQRLDGSPAAALLETQRISAMIMDVSAHQDYLLDNISNTLEVAVADAQTAKRLFFFLGIPGGFLAAMLAAYAASVLASAQRREQATLRIRGADKQHLLKMLALRTVLITGAGSIIGLFLGLGVDVALLGYESLARAGIIKLAVSALLGTVGGFLTTGISLYVTGHISIERQINEDRARYAEHSPFWRRADLDILGVAVLVIGTVAALRFHAFEGAAGSVYFGRGVELNLALLVFPVAVWFTGSFFAMRIFAALLSRIRAHTTSSVVKPWPDLFRFSVSRRPWPIGNGALIVSLIVALATSLAAFTASYNNAKAEDARYANGSDIRITPGPTDQNHFAASDMSLFRVDGVADVTPVIYGVQNVILRSARTSDPANMAAIDPKSFGAVAPLHDADFVDINAAEALEMLQDDPDAILLSVDMANFLQASLGDSLHVLLVRGTAEQVEVTLHITGLFTRLPGCPDGVQALMSIERHTAHAPAKLPDYFLAATSAAADDAGLQDALEALQNGPGSRYELYADSRTTILAKDQSSLAALNIAGLVELDSVFSLAMAAVTIGIFVFGLLLQRRREYITLRAQGLESSTIRLLIAAEAGTIAIGGSFAGVLVGVAMGLYFVKVLQPLFVHVPRYIVPLHAVAVPIVLVCIGTMISSIAGSRLVNGLQPTELLRDE